MMKLTAQLRESSTSLDEVRGAGMIPAVCYGDGETVSISLSRSDFIRVYREAGSSAIIELDGFEGDSKDVLVKEIQRHPVSEEILHVDLYATTKGEAIEAEVSLVFEGESRAEKAGAQVVKVLREVMVAALPKDLPSEIVVDMTKLENAGDNILIKDLPVAEGVEILADQEDPVVTTSVAQEIEEEEVPTEIDMSAIESEQKGKGEEAEGGDSE